MSKKHIGEILDFVAENHALPKVNIIEMAGYASQSTYYKHIVRNDLPFKILYKYARAMNYNFSKEIPEFTNWLKNNNLVIADVSNDKIETLALERDQWKEKYYEQMKEYNELMKEHNSLIKNYNDLLKRGK